MELPAAKERRCPWYWKAWQSGKLHLSGFSWAVPPGGVHQGQFQWTLGRWEDWVAKYSTKVQTEKASWILKISVRTYWKLNIWPDTHRDSTIYSFFYNNSTLLWNSLIRILLAFHKARKRQGLSSALDSFQASSPASSLSAVIHAGPTPSPVSLASLLDTFLLYPAPDNFLQGPVGALGHKDFLCSLFP